MSFSIVRMAENEDLEQVRKAAGSFCQRHSISVQAGKGPEIAIYTRIYDDSYRQDYAIRDAWQRDFCKALGQEYSPSLSIEGDHIGYSR